MNTRSARVLRGLVAASFAVFVAALSHVAGGGSAPGVVGLALALAFSAVVCVALAGRSLSLIRLSVSVAFSQLLFHLLFSIGAGSSASTGISMTSMGHHGMAVISVVDPGLLAGTAPGDVTGCSWMWFAHAFAALATIFALRRGERAFWGLYQTARMHVARLVRPPFSEPRPAVPLRASAWALEPHCLRDLADFRSSTRHRGPPFGVISA